MSLHDYVHHWVVAHPFQFFNCLLSAAAHPKAIECFHAVQTLQMQLVQRECSAERGNVKCEDWPIYLQTCSSRTKNACDLWPQRFSYRVRDCDARFPGLYQDDNFWKKWVKAHSIAGAQNSELVQNDGQLGFMFWCILFFARNLGVDDYFVKNILIGRQII